VNGETFIAPGKLTYHCLQT